MLTLEQRHQLCLYPEVRIRADKAGGSGTIIYSQPGEERCETYVLTNHHVVASQIKVEKQWDTLLQRDRKRDVLGTPQVEVFQYDFGSRVIGGTSYQTDIVCYDKNEDMALLRIRAPQQFPWVAQMYPRDQVEELQCFMPVWTVGCGLGEKPVITAGFLSSFGNEIDNKDYFLSTASSIFGNSGGATFLGETGEMIGVPARVMVVFIGWSADPIAHMGYSIPIWRVYQFLEDQMFQFIYDDSYTSVQCQQMRESRRQREDLAQLRDELYNDPEGANVNPKGQMY